MRQAGQIALVIGLVSLVLGIYARMTFARIGPGALEAQAFLQFTQACFLFAIAASLASCKKSTS